jgi:hypothetical protein
MDETPVTFDRLARTEEADLFARENFLHVFADPPVAPRPSPYKASAPKRAGKALPVLQNVEDEGEDLQKPKRRSECQDGLRPCPWVSCRYNLYLDIRADGVLRINFPDRDPHEMAFSCALDLAEDGPRTLDQVAGLMGMSRERARQIEEKVLSHVRREYDHDEFDDIL